MNIDISYRRILALAGPVVITQMTHTAMGLIDAMMVGRLGVVALAGVGLGAIISWWLLGFFVGLLQGVNTFVAQFFGAGKKDRVGVAFWQGLYLAAGAGVAVLLAAPLSGWAFRVMGASAEVQAIATDYTEVRLGAAVGLMIFLVAENYYRGLGRTEVPMFAGLIQLALNCGLNYLLIFGVWGFPELGAAGTAVGTVIAQFLVAVGLLAGVLATKIGRDYGATRPRPPEAALLGQMLRVSLPIGVQVFMEMGGISVFTALVANLGDAEMAATNAVIHAWSVSFMLAVALAVGCTTLVGQCLGARQLDDVRVVVRRVMWLGYGAMAIMAVIYVGFPGWLMQLFAREAGDLAALLPYARPLFLICTLCLLFELPFNIYSGALRGAGDTTYPMVVNIGVAWLVFVPLVFFATRNWGLVGAWSCFIVHVALLAGLLAVRVRGRTWIERGASLLDAERAAGGATASVSEVDDLRSSPAL